MGNTNFTLISHSYMDGVDFEIHNPWNESDFNETIVAEDFKSISKTPEYIAATAIWAYVAPLILIVGTVGSILSLLVLCRKSLRCQTTMFYLAALAITDILGLYVGLIRLWLEKSHDIYLRLTSNAACKIHTFSVYVVLDTSVWILVAVSIDRCLYVNWPHLARRWCTLQKARITVAAILVALILVNMHFLWTYKMEQYETEQVYAHAGRSCYADTTSPGIVDFIQMVWPWLDFCVYCLFPFIFMVVCNAIIIKQLIRTERKMASHTKTALELRKNGNTCKAVNKITDIPQTALEMYNSRIPTDESRTRNNDRQYDAIKGGKDESTSDPLTKGQIRSVSLQENTSSEPPTSHASNVQQACIKTGVAASDFDHETSTIVQSSSDRGCQNNLEGHPTKTTTAVSLGTGGIPLDVMPPVVEFSGNPAGLSQGMGKTQSRRAHSDPLPHQNTTTLMRGSEESDSVSSQQTLLLHEKNSQNHIIHFANGCPEANTSNNSLETGMAKKLEDVYTEDNGDILTPSNVVTNFVFEDDDKEMLVKASKKRSATDDAHIHWTIERKRTLSNKVHPSEGKVDPREDCPKCTSGDGKPKQWTRQTSEPDSSVLDITAHDKDLLVSKLRNKEHVNDPGIDGSSLTREGVRSQNTVSNTDDANIFSLENAANRNQLTTVDEINNDGTSEEAVDKRNNLLRDKPRGISVLSEGQPSRRTTGSVSKTLLAVTIMFWIFNSPIAIFIISHTYLSYGADVQSRARLILTWAVVNILQYLNNAMHFFLYCLTSPKFRQELKDMLKAGVRMVKRWRLE